MSHLIEVCREMGYSENEIQKAFRDLSDKGEDEPTEEMVVNLIEDMRERKAQNVPSSGPNESVLEENRRLKKLWHCLLCQENLVNALLLPCSHLKLCMTCADQLQTCPICNKKVEQKISTYMALRMT